MTWRTYGGKPYARTISTDMRWTHGLGRRSQLDTSFSYGHNRYSTNKLQDGDQYSLGLSLDRALSARGGVGVSLSGARQTARDAAYATTSGGVTLLGWRDMGKTTLFVNTTARRLESDAGLVLGSVRNPAPAPGMVPAGGSWRHLPPDRSRRLLAGRARRL